MTLETLIQLIITGISMGSIYGLVALGFVVIYKATGVFNLAQGEFLMVGTYVAWTFLSLFKLPVWLGIVLTIAVMIALGFGLERFPLRPMIGQSILSLIMVTIALGAVLMGVATLFWSPYYAPVLPRILPEQDVVLFGVKYPGLLIWGFLIVLILTAIFGLMFRYTRIGLNMRAVAESQHVAQSMGIRVTRVTAQSWAVAAVTAAAGGIILGLMRGVDFALVNLGIKAIPAALVGGLESIPGALIGGILIGVIESLTGGYLGQGLKDITPFVIMMIVLFIKPYGIFGLERIERV